MGCLQSLDEEQRRAARENLSEEELALFDLLEKPDLSQAARGRVKLSSKKPSASLRELVAPVEHWPEKEPIQVEVKVFIRDHLHQVFPSLSFSDQGKEDLVEAVFGFVWQQSIGGIFGKIAMDE